MIEFKKRSTDEILLEKGKIKIDQLKKAWDVQKETNKSIEDVLIELGFVSKKDVVSAIAKSIGVDFVDLSFYQELNGRILEVIPVNIVKRYKLLPISIDINVLKIAMKDPTDLFALDDVRLATKYEIEPSLADEVEIERLIEKYFPDKPAVEEPQVHEEIAAVTEYAEISYPTIGAKRENAEEVNQEGSKEVVLKEVVLNEDFTERLKEGSGESRKKNVTEFRNDAKEEDGGNRPLVLKEKLGRMLVKSGVITEAQLSEALKIQSKTGERLGEIVVKENFVSKKTLYEFLEMQLEIPHIDLENANISKNVVELINENIARRYKLIPLEKRDNLLKVAMSDPLNIFSLDDLRLATGLEIIPLLADAEQVDVLLNKYFPKGREKNKTDSGEQKSSPKKVVDFEEEMKKVNEEIAIEIVEDTQEEDIDITDIQNAPIVKMVNIIFNKAIASRASDIHVEPYEDCVMIRYRIDGQLVEAMKHDKKILPALVARIKIISGLNIAEKRIPQDGRISLKVDSGSFDLRVSILPSMFGEKVVIRISDKNGFNVSKKDLGFFDEDLEKFDEILDHPHGIVLVTGPTGSGKSTTLYTALRELSKPNVNILTVEDPVESIVRGVTQVHVNAKAGLTFAIALRSFLRQDPDIIMVGEIRDSETAEIATRAAITGHLVLSTLHTNDSASSVTRMVDMGIEPYMISSSLVGIIAQRLVRRLCPKCKELYVPDQYEAEALGIEGDSEEVKVYKAKGCPECNNTGYRGRIAIYEIMTITRELRVLIAKGVNSDILKDEAIKGGMRTLRMNCERLVKDGVTTIDEMMRVTFSKD